MVYFYRAMADNGSNECSERAAMRVKGCYPAQKIDQKLLPDIVSISGGQLQSSG
jgi:hypothetical protein